MNPPKDFSIYRDAVKNRDVELSYNPPVIYIEAAKGCPHACAMCHFQRTKVETMDASLLSKLEPYFKDLEVLAIHGQGEPLLGNLGYFTEQAVKNRFALHMNTTGLLLTKNISDMLSRARLSIRFSVHAGKQETYKRLLGQDLNRVRKNIAYLINRAETSGYDNDFWFSFLVLKENIDEIEDFLHMAHDCGIKSVRFMRLIPNLNTLRGVKFPDRNFSFNYFEQFNEKILNQFNNSFPRYQALSKELGIRIEFGSLMMSSSSTRPVLETINNAILRLFGNNLFPLTKVPGFCLAPWIGQLVINLSGNVRPCCLTSYSLGNLHETSLSEIWNGRKIKNIRAAFAEGHNPKACAYCRGFSWENYPKNSFNKRGEIG